MKRKAIAIAVTRKRLPFSLTEFMYGSKERAKITIIFAYALLALSVVLSIADAYSATAVCSF